MTVLPEAASLAQVARSERRLRADCLVVEASLGPLFRDEALRALPFQPRLAAPAKLVVAAEWEPRLQAEVPRALDRHACEKLAREALDAALFWLDAGCPERRGDADATPATEDVEEGLGALPWSWEPDGAGGYRVHARDLGTAARLRVDSIGAAALRVSTASALRLVGSAAREAGALFALECNRRLRLARLSVAGAGAGAVRVEWDAVLPGALPVQRALPVLLEAVAFAQAETSRALAVLGDERVAKAYLRLRPQAPDRARKR